MARLTVAVAISTFLFAWASADLLRAEDGGHAPAAPPPAEAPAADDRAQSPDEVRLTSGTEPAPSDNPPTAGDAKHEAPSDAERIARLERSVAADEKRVRELRENLHLPHGEYAKAEASFRELDAEKDALKQKLAEAQESGPADDWARIQADQAALEKKWSLAKERFDLAISERKANQESLVTLESKLKSDHETLDKLRGTGEPAKLEMAAAPAPAAVPPATPPAADPPVAAAMPAAPNSSSVPRRPRPSRLARPRRLPLPPLRWLPTHRRRPPLNRPRRSSPRR